MHLQSQAVVDRTHLKPSKFRVQAAVLLVGAIAIHVSTSIAQDTLRVSVGSSGQEANGQSWIDAISADGRFVCFTSSAPDLVTGDSNGWSDVFVRDRHLGTTRRVSVHSNGNEGTGGFSGWGALSADGRLIAFQSQAVDLVANDTNGFTDIFVHDSAVGTTDRVSIGMGGEQSNGHSVTPSISADGRYIVFTSYASNLAWNDPNSVPDVFRYDRQTGATELVSVRIGGHSGVGESFSYVSAVSADGNLVVFSSNANDLVVGDGNGQADSFIRNMQAGLTLLMSVSSAGIQANGSSSVATISGSGRYATFTSSADNLAGVDVNGAVDVFLRDVQLGTTTLVSVGLNGMAGAGESRWGLASDDGRYVTFHSFAADLDPQDSNPWEDIFVRDTLAGVTRQVSLAWTGAQPDDAVVYWHPAISSDGLWVGFSSHAINLVPGDGNGVHDVFLRFHREAEEPLCFGDGSGTPCPCSWLNGLPGHGCENSFFTGGGLLAASGAPTMSTDTIRLTCSSLPPTTTAVFFQGTSDVGGGGGNAFGDGLRCVAGTIVRIGTKLVSGGTTTLGYEAGGPVISVQGGVPATGGVRYYHVWYRNGADWCTPATFNTTNAIRVVWLP